MIEPLFLDDLRAEFRRMQDRQDGRAAADLRRFRDKLGLLRLFDPACGCGNFLIIAYRELRTLEIDVLREAASRATATHLTLAVQSESASTRAALPPRRCGWMDHIMNNRLSLEFGQSCARIPIEEIAVHPQRGRAGDRLSRPPAAR